MKTMANLTRDDIREVIETIKGLYLEDMIPWIWRIQWRQRFHGGSPAGLDGAFGIAGG